MLIGIITGLLTWLALLTHTPSPIQLKMGILRWQVVYPVDGTLPYRRFTTMAGIRVHGAAYGTPVASCKWHGRKQSNRGGQMSKPELDTIFMYHAPKEGQPERYVRLREKAKELAQLVVGLTPQSREQSVALTNIQQAVMWANAAIAINESKGV